MVVNPYIQTDIGPNKFQRIFKEETNESEFVWHRDHFDRDVYVIESRGWKLQLDNKLPTLLTTGSKIFIPKNTYHRLIKGQGNLVITINELR